MAKQKKKSIVRLARTRVYGRPEGQTGGVSWTGAKDDNLVQKLTSADSKERSIAATRISTMVDDQEARDQLLRQKLTQTLLQHSLTDSDQQVVVTAYGILRSLALHVGYDLCTFLYRQDILTPISSSMIKIEAVIEGVKSDRQIEGQNQLRSMLSFAESVISLITSLCLSSYEVQDLILTKLTDLPNLLIDILSLAGKVPTILVTTAAECLFMVSDSPDKKLPIPIDIVKKLSTNDKLSRSARVYLQGTLHMQYSSFDEIKDPDEMLDGMFNVFKTIINVIKEINVQEALEILNNTPEGSRIDKKYLDAGDMLTAVQCSLEQIAGIAENVSLHLVANASETSGMDKMEEDEDEGEELQSENTKEGKEDDVNFDVDMKSSDDEDDGPHDLRISPFIILLKEIVPYLLPLLQYDQTRSRSLACLSNLLWVVAGLKEKWSRVSTDSLVIEVSSTVMSLLNNKSNNPNILGDDDQLQSLIGTIGALWACAQLQTQQVANNTSPESVQFLIHIYTRATKAGDKVHQEEYTELKTRIVGFLGTIGQVQGHIDRTQMIGDFLLHTLQEIPIASSVKDKLTEPQVAIEALNCFFDIFGDKTYDYDQPVFVNGNYLKTLSDNVLPKVRAMAKRIDKVHDAPLRERADEALHNLRRFIDYKQHE